MLWQSEYQDLIYISRILSKQLSAYFVKSQKLYFLQTLNTVFIDMVGGRENNLRIDSCRRYFIHT